MERIAGCAAGLSGCALPALLAEAHRELDEAVFAAYGWPYTLTDADILEHLLATSAPDHSRLGCSQPSHMSQM